MTGFLSRRERPAVRPSIFIMLSSISACLCCFFNSFSFLCRKAVLSTNHQIQMCISKEKIISREMVDNLLNRESLPHKRKCKWIIFQQRNSKPPCGPSQFQEAGHFSISFQRKPLFYFYLKKASPARNRCNIIKKEIKHCKKKQSAKNWVKLYLTWNMS